MPDRCAARGLDAAQVGISAARTIQPGASVLRYGVMFQGYPQFPGPPGP